VCKKKKERARENEREKGARTNEEGWGRGGVEERERIKGSRVGGEWGES